LMSAGVKSVTDMDVRWDKLWHKKQAQKI
jgi:hypothetical protein